MREGQRWLQSRPETDIFFCRKKELVKFACRSRQLFIRTLAVVKWAATAGKVNACDVSIHLTVLANLFGAVHRRSRASWNDARASCGILQIPWHSWQERNCWMPGTMIRTSTLPSHVYLFRLANFPITDAVDTLTLGSVNFLPERISVNHTIVTRWKATPSLFDRKPRHRVFPLAKRNAKRFSHACTKSSLLAWPLPNYPFNSPASPSVRDCRETTVEVCSNVSMSDSRTGNSHVGGGRGIRSEVRRDEWQSLRLLACLQDETVLTRPRRTRYEMTIESLFSLRDQHWVRSASVFVEQELVHPVQVSK